MVDRRDFMAATGAGIAGLAVGRSASAGPLGGKPVNVLFVMTDQQRWDTLSRAGNKILRTPNLDRLAREGAYFENAYTNCPICVPARAVMLTGHSTHSVRVERNSDYDRADVAELPTFDGILAGKRHHTEYYGKWHTPYKFAATYRNKVRQTGKHSRGTGIPGQRDAYVRWLDAKVLETRELRAGELIDKSTGRPYRADPLDWRYGMTQSELDERAKAARRAKRGKGGKAKPDKLSSQAGSYGRLDIPAEYTRTAFVAREVLDVLDRVKDRPFSLTCSFGPPHPPMVLPRPYYGMYPADEIPAPASIDDPMDNSPYAARARSEEMKRYRNRAHVQQMTSNYYGMVREVDDWVGRLLAKLKELGLEKNTLVVFTSDHGEMLGDHGMHSKMVFYEGAAHIPLIMRLPGAVPAGTVVTGPVSHVDIFATILDYTGARAPKSEGRSLRGLIEGKGDGGVDFCVSEWPSGGGPNYMVRTVEWKYICSRSSTTRTLDALYNMRDDPHEMTNLIGKNPDRKKYARQAEEMKARLVRWLESTNSPHARTIRARPAVR